MSLMSERTSSDSADLRGMRRRPVRELAAIIRLSRTLIVLDESLQLAVGRHEADACRDRRARAAEERRPTRDLDVPVPPGARPKIASSSSERPAPTSPASPTTSPGATSSETFSNAPGRLKSRTRRTASPIVARPVVRRIEVLELAADHQRDQARAVEVGDHARRRRVPVAEDRDAVGEREELAEAVRDEDRRDALGAQPPDEPEERLDLVLGERARRLVEDQHARVDRERPRDLDHLLLVGPQPAHRHRRVEVEIEAGERLLRAAAGRAPVDEPARRTMRCPRKMFSAIERSGASVVSCVTVAMPWRSASVGSRKLVALPAEGDRAAVGLNLAREDLQHRRLARPVLAEQRVDLARIDRQAGAAQGVHAAVTLVDALGVEDRIGTRAHRVSQARRGPPGSRPGSRAGARALLDRLDLRVPAGDRVDVRLRHDARRQDDELRLARSTWSPGRRPP